MEEYRMPLNFIANLVLSFAFALFMIFLFGRTNSKIYTLPWYKTLAVRVGMALCASGALLNVFTFSDAPWSEVILNTGLAFTFTWAAWFHYKTFVIPYKNTICNSEEILDFPVKRKAKRSKRPLTKR